MTDPRPGIAYQPEDLTERRLLEWQGVSLQLVRVPPVAHSFTHRSGSHLMMFTERGRRADGESRADGQKISTMRDTSGTFSLIPADCAYDGWTVPTLPAQYLSLLIDPGAPLFDGDAGLAELCQAATVYAAGLPATIVATLDKLKRALRAPEEHGILYAQTLVALLMMELFGWRRGMPAQGEARGGLAPWQERRAKELVMAHLDGGLALDRLAAECGLSAGHFARAFRRSVGTPPHRWLMERRIDRAKDRLALRSGSLAEIALDCGFRDQSHFTRSFTQIVGQPPAAWRREHGG